MIAKIKENLRNGYPVIIWPAEYDDILLAVGCNDEGSLQALYFWTVMMTKTEIIILIIILIWIDGLKKLKQSSY